MTRIVAPLVPAQDVSLWWTAKVKLPRERRPRTVDVFGFGHEWNIASWWADGFEQRLPCEVLIDGRRFAASIQDEPLSLVLEPVDSPQIPAEWC